MEFEDCENVQIPLNVDATLTALDNLTYNEETNNQNEIDDALNILYPTSDQTFKPSLDKEFLKFYMASANKLQGSVKIEDIDKNLLSNLHTIYLDKLK